MKTSQAGLREDRIDPPDQAADVHPVAAGIAFVTSIAAILIIEVYGTWRARMSVAREEAYRAREESVAAQRRRAKGLVL